MTTDHRIELAGIRRFDQLVRYLRDRMGWPIDGGDFEELTFEYTPEELGIDAKNAAKILEIKRLRPLAPNQPWGIFFVKFEPKRLPVVALRRVLSQVVIRKRASANKSDRQAWAADDLLFVSNYGEGEERQISFAHFSTPKDGLDLPTLRVLGWDNLDTALHLDAVARELSEHLAWPEDEQDVDAWRQQWRAAFTLRHREVITTSRDLSIRLAELARAIRDRIKTAVAIETEHGPLTKLMKAFQAALIHDLDADGFADMYAQTIAYGLLSARIANPQKKTADDFAGHMRTNPFLRELMETFLKVGGRRGRAGGPDIDFDELGVSEVVELLDDPNTHMEAVVRDFGDRNPQEDPVIHFYELFLKEYDAKKRMQRGVFYTPRPVVSYIVRSVDELLRTEFALEDGLADTTSWGEMVKRHKGLNIPKGAASDQAFVQILDPATGTGTFLVEVIDLIHRTMTAKWKARGHGEKKIDELWNEYVPKNLLTRLHGYELLMAPYAIAHLKVGLKLFDTGYRFGSDERARIYLTNSLEPASTLADTKAAGLFEALGRETQAVNDVKRNKRFTVVIGNPPYSNFGRLNRVPFILGLLRDYKDGLDEKKLNLDDDYLKFFRFGQHLTDAAGAGVMSLITNSSYLDGVVHRRMRESLLRSFAHRLILDLHGNSRRREVAPTGKPDQNVFEIQQGAAISVWVKQGRTRSSGILHWDLWGSREAKYQELLEHTALSRSWNEVEPRQPQFFFVAPTNPASASEYEAFYSLSKVFNLFSSGMTAERDHVAIHFTRAELEETLREFRSGNVEFLRRKYQVGEDSRDWTVARAVADARKHTNDKELIQRVLYRPFDYRFTWYSGTSRGFVGTPVPLTGVHLVGGKNIALLAPRQTKERVGVFLSASLAGHKSFSAYDRTSVFPLWLKSGEPERSAGLFEAQRQSNFRPDYVEAVQRALGYGFKRSAAPRKAASSEELFHYIYAVLNSSTYRTRYEDLLKVDFPRLPLPGSAELFQDLARLGGELVPLHVMKSPELDDFITSYSGPKNPEVGRVGWSDETVWLDIAEARKDQPAPSGTTGFRGVPEAVWNFHVGGYQVCEKWLKDRRGRSLSKDDLAHYQKIVVALSETIRLMGEIDEVIEKHGGWPAAFKVTRDDAAPPLPVPFPPRVVQPRPEDRYVTCVPLVPLKVAAGAFSDPQHVEDGTSEWVAIDSTHRLCPGMFVAQVVGKSMEPAIPDGAFCLFVAPVTGTRQGKTVLAQLRDATDPETGERYTVKRYESEKTKDGDSWRHARITLRPVNPDFKPIVLTGGEEGQVQVIAECIEVLRRGP